MVKEMGKLERNEARVGKNVEKMRKVVFETIVPFIREKGQADDFSR